ncbi:MULTISPECIES: LysR substrate-binding domain-containing protein [unclassified Acinetobacter]|uniref:LysR substrate-binding domain-containing protein n=1 Tax=unclassified Acinetobacter TaxID=196816 RepID=UPI002934D70B|nr:MULTISPECIES: LysR substrate-binding domain-containing protein [unclassified Acinetobacter]WOE31464.1 LysR substrate-binding domain-containing protein [Acinetobacter sp. SAAs470]WOE39660.1 LysR substrate-binding domain-containing protein [Acinetobacter sp. SAAs474]
MKRRHLPSLNALKAFEAVARHQSFSLAAEELCVTHSAISHQIKYLEQWFDQKLFIRHSSKISLHHNAVALANLCTDLFNQLETSVMALNQQSAEVEIVIGASHSFMANWLIARLEKLELCYPHIHIKLMICNELKNLEKNKVDIFINSLHMNTALTEPFEKHLLFADNMGPVYNHKLYQPQHIEDLLQYPRLHTHSNQQAWSIWCNRNNLDSLTKTHDRYFDHLNLMIEAAVSGLGIAIAPEILVEKEILNQRLSAPFGFHFCDYHFYAIIRKNADRHNLIEIIDWLKHTA